jgi:hypothetical protein
MALFDYLEVFYNQRRRQSTLGQISPAAFRTTYRRSLDRDGALAGSHARTPDADPNAAERL